MVVSGLYFLGLVLLGTAVVLVALSAVLHARKLLRPRRLTDGRALAVLGRVAPDDVGVREWEEEVYHVNGIDMPAWWVPAEGGSDTTVVHLHGYASSRIATLAWLPLWRKLGVNVLLPDLRAHGEAGGDVCTAGWLERDDVDAVLNELRAKRPAATRRLVLAGNSMGAAVAAATAVRRDDVDAVLLDSPVPSHRLGAARHGDLIGAALPSFAPASVRLAERWAGADWEAVSATTLIPQLDRPLVVLPRRDVYLNDATRAALAAATDRASGALLEPDCGHMLGYAADPAGYEAAVRALLAGDGPEDDVAARPPRPAASAVASS